MTYIVTHGEYSDYRVLCAAPDRETAEAIAARINRVEGNKPGGWNSADVEDVVDYDSAEAIPCYLDKRGDAIWPWSLDFDPERATKVASDEAAKGAAEAAGL